jgi:hypothetical protein
MCSDRWTWQRTQQEGTAMAAAINKAEGASDRKGDSLPDLQAQAER